MSRLVRRLLAGAGLTVLTVGVLAAPAAAHVSVNAPEATQGGFTVLTFRVPTEKDVPTTSIRVQFPEEAPLSSVSVQPKPGWDYTVDTATLDPPVQGENGEITEAVSVITWTTTGEGIAAGEFDEFRVSAGPLPETDQMVFKVIQVYQGGEEVAWIQEPTGNGEEPERPAPVLQLATADEGTEQADDTDGANSPAGDTEAETDDAAEADDDAASQGSVTAALVVAVLGLLAGLGGLGLAFWTRRGAGGTSTTS